MKNVIPKILGNENYASSKNRQCRNWPDLISRVSLNSPPVSATPDYCEGQSRDNSNVEICDALGPEIVPSLGPGMPILPNFFLEAKGSDGTMAVADRQAIYDGALGARGMHRLQMYGLKTFYDQKAYTISTIYMNGILTIYSHHLLPSETPNKPPHYRTRYLMTSTIIDSLKEYRRGVAALRNLQDLAHDFRVDLLRGANRRLEILEERKPPLRRISALTASEHISIRQCACGHSCTTMLGPAC